MKKIALVLGVVLLLVGNVTVAFADAASYDIEPADYYVYVATPDGGLNMRYGPGTEYDKVMPERIPDNVRLYIKYKSGNWGYTAYNGNDGWVALRQTTTTPPAQPTTQPVTEPVTPAYQPIEEGQPSQEAVVVEENPTVDVENPEEKAEDARILESAMLNQIILIAILVILVIFIAILALVIVNIKRK